MFNVYGKDNTSTYIDMVVKNCTAIHKVGEGRPLDLAAQVPQQPPGGPGHELFPTPRLDPVLQERGGDSLGPFVRQERLLDIYFINIRQA